MALKLGVNIDHVATLRQARYATLPDLPNAEPILAELALEAVAGGADSITIHLREDRRHIQDRDVIEICRDMKVPVNLEMGNTQEILEIAIANRPTFVCLVPEHREEITTEGGLDAMGLTRELEPTVRRLQKAGILVSLFIDPSIDQIHAASLLKADMIELHTGAFANAHVPEEREAELQRLILGAQRGFELGLQVNAGHGINTSNIRDLDRVPHLVELNIGHHLVSRALLVGLRQAVAEMQTLMNAYPG